ncbi:phytanoyl-CoA dioxygenase family protein [Bacillaceae bacterium SIJ1]|uniref:phytanoyl-CoA dioxygenase family protein n=1 Tax=Litoribacterium kuwaitense TaxID=1398745 RepID=UPI0013EA93FC|nr:phytanoyl-CoA dioxygenase family protein [Litoribacterium kuwaitense]NGP45542.1 phytanoyl-CoA dioxygenase family protein [Litoribacterium kuwaitense]
MTNSYKENFNREGYVVIKSLLSEHEVHILKDEAVKVLNDKQVNNEGVYLGMAVASPAFKKFAANPKLVTALKEIIGNDVVFLSVKIVFKNAGTDFGSPWHQDYPYWEGSHKYSVWVALDDARLDNGCLRVVPGSHLLGDIRHNGDASDGLGFGNRLNEEEIDPTKVIDLPVAKGDAIIFHDLLLHASRPNQSGKDRWALISTYKDGTQEDPPYNWAKAAFPISSSE